MPTASPSALTDLARSLGIATEFTDWKGKTVQVPESTIRTVLEVFGVDTTDEFTLAHAAAERANAAWRRVLPPVVVLREGRTHQVPVHVPHGTQPRVELRLEDGRTREIAQLQRWVDPREVDGVLTGEATYELPADLPLGYHVLVATLDGQAHECEVIVTPQRLALPPALESGQAWGLMAQLYAVRSRRSWGIGDAADLAELADWAGRQGGDFVLVNPVHAAEPVAPMEPSPYLPTSRRFVNPLYIRVEEIPEVGYADAPTRAAIDAAAARGHELNETDRLERDASWAAKDAVLRRLHAAGRSERRQAQFEAFVAREGQGLVDYATWCAITRDRGGVWPQWPVQLQDARSAAVAAERDRLADEVDYAC